MAEIKQLKRRLLVVKKIGQVGAGNIILFPTSENAPPAPDDNFIAFEVSGNSLETPDARTSIFDGEILICKRRFTAKEVKTSLCIVRVCKTELLVRRLETNGDGVTLSAPNGDSRNVEAKDLEVLAIVINVMRNV